jgi:hypothetical protein
LSPGDGSDIEEDEPDEPGHVSNNSMSHFSDENNAILIASTNIFIERKKKGSAEPRAAVFVRSL